MSERLRSTTMNSNKIFSGSDEFQSPKCRIGDRRVVESFQSILSAVGYNVSYPLDNATVGQSDIYKKETMSHAKPVSGEYLDTRPEPTQTDMDESVITNQQTTSPTTENDRSTSDKTNVTVLRCTQVSKENFETARKIFLTMPLGISARETEVNNSTFSNNVELAQLKNVSKDTKIKNFFKTHNKDRIRSIMAPDPLQESKIKSKAELSNREIHKADTVPIVSASRNTRADHSDNKATLPDCHYRSHNEGKAVLVNEISRSRPINVPKNHGQQGLCPTTLDEAENVIEPDTPECKLERAHCLGDNMKVRVAEETLESVVVGLKGNTEEMNNNRNNNCDKVDKARTAKNITSKFSIGSGLANNQIGKEEKGNGRIPLSYQGDLKVSSTLPELTDSKIPLKTVSVNTRDLQLGAEKVFDIETEAQELRREIEEFYTLQRMRIKNEHMQATGQRHVEVYSETHTNMYFEESHALERGLIVDEMMTNLEEINVLNYRKCRRNYLCNVEGCCDDINNVKGDSNNDDRVDTNKENDNQKITGDIKSKHELSEFNMTEMKWINCKKHDKYIARNETEDKVSKVAKANEETICWPFDEKQTSCQSNEIERPTYTETFVIGKRAHMEYTREIRAWNEDSCDDGYFVKDLGIDNISINWHGNCDDEAMLYNKNKDIALEVIDKVISNIGSDGEDSSTKADKNGILNTDEIKNECIAITENGWRQYVTENTAELCTTNTELTSLGNTGSDNTDEFEPVAYEIGNTTLSKASEGDNDKEDNISQEPLVPQTPNNSATCLTEALLNIGWNPSMICRSGDDADEEISYSICQENHGLSRKSSQSTIVYRSPSERSSKSTVTFESSEGSWGVPIRATDCDVAGYKSPSESTASSSVSEAPVHTAAETKVSMELVEEELSDLLEDGVHQLVRYKTLSATFKKSATEEPKDSDCDSLYGHNTVSEWKHMEVHLERNTCTEATEDVMDIMTGAEEVNRACHSIEDFLYGEAPTNKTNQISKAFTPASKSTFELGSDPRIKDIWNTRGFHYSMVDTTFDKSEHRKRGQGTHTDKDNIGKEFNGQQKQVAGDLGTWNDDMTTKGKSDSECQNFQVRDFEVSSNNHDYYVNQNIASPANARNVNIVGDIRANEVAPKSFAASAEPPWLNQMVRHTNREQDSLVAKYSPSERLDLSSCLSGCLINPEFIDEKLLEFMDRKYYFDYREKPAVRQCLSNMSSVSKYSGSSDPYEEHHDCDDFTEDTMETTAQQEDDIFLDWDTRSAIYTHREEDCRPLHVQDSCLEFVQDVVELVRFNFERIAGFVVGGSHDFVDENGTIL